MIFLITPTGARPLQIKLCGEFMKRQTYKGDVTWIIVDDCKKRTTDFIGKDFIPNWDIVKMYPIPYWKIGDNTQGRNMTLMTDYILDNYRKKNIEAIYVIEDDDYYRPDYLVEMRKRIEGYDAAGETNTVYYNLRVRRWYEHANLTWSSLFQTVFTWKMIPLIQSLSKERLIDYAFFPKVENKNLFYMKRKLAIGMKGLPGRGGIGAGHEFIKHMIPDPEHKKLKQLLGKDYNFYDIDLCGI